MILKLWSRSCTNQSVGGCVPEREPEVVDADHRGQQILLLAAADQSSYLGLDNGHLPPLKHNQGIVVCVEVHICGCVKRGENPGLEMNENKGGEILLGVEFGACACPSKCLHISSTPA